MGTPSNTEIKLDKKAVEFYLLCRNLRYIAFPLILSTFILLGELGGSFSGMRFDFSRLHTIISLVYIAALVMYLFTLIQAKTLKYEIEGDKLQMQFGVFFHTEVNIKFEKITDVESYSGMLEKIIGMQIIKVQTAGRGKNDPEIEILAPLEPKAVAQSILTMSSQA